MYKKKRVNKIFLGKRVVIMNIVSTRIQLIYPFKTMLFHLYYTNNRNKYIILKYILGLNLSSFFKTRFVKHI